MSDEKHEEKQGKVARFFEEKGFYIILFLCVAAIGVAGWVLFGPVDDSEDEQIAAASGSILPSETGVSEDVSDLPETVADIISGDETAANIDAEDDADVDADADSTQIPVSDELGEESGNEANEVSAIDSDADATVKQAAQNLAEDAQSQDVSVSSEPEGQDAEVFSPQVPSFYVRPVAGEVIQEFSGDELVYNRTMGDWRTHNGVDLAATEGEQVLAIADGTIEEITNDEFYGTCIVIDHGAGLKSTYMGLIENATVTVGQEVSAGDVIGAVSSTALFEALEPVHLHLEMTLDDARVDPVQYLP